MRLNKFKCNICGKVFGLDNTGWGTVVGEWEPRNPRKVEDVHLCESCIAGVSVLGVKLCFVNYNLTTSQFEVRRGKDDPLL